VEEAEVDDDGEDLIELQNSRTTAIGVGNYSVPIDIVKHLNVRSMDAFRPLSMAWHRFLGVVGKGKADKGVDASVSTASASTARKRVLRNSIAEMAVLPRGKERRVEDVREEEIRKALR
jgi:hypothetical protein